MVTFGNAVIWAAVVVAAAYLGVNPVLYTGIIPGAAVVSLAATYRLVDNDENGCL